MFINWIVNWLKEITEDDGISLFFGGVFCLLILILSLIFMPLQYKILFIGITLILAEWFYSDAIKEDKSIKKTDISDMIFIKIYGIVVCSIFSAIPIFLYLHHKKILTELRHIIDAILQTNWTPVLLIIGSTVLIAGVIYGYFWSNRYTGTSIIENKKRGKKK